MKTYVIDTNVILYDCAFMYRIREAQIVIPLTVLEEVDKFKKDPSEIGRNARQFSREIEKIRVKGDLVKGIPIKNKSILKVDMAPKPCKNLDYAKPDNRILGTAITYKANQKNGSVVLLSKDINLRVIGSVFGVDCKDYEPEKTKDTGYAGYRTVPITELQLESFINQRQLPNPVKLLDNEYVILQTPSGMQGLGRYIKGQGIVAIKTYPKGLWDLQPKNMEQSFAFDCLMDPSIHLVTLVGKAGTGKTLLAIAAGLQLSLEESKYRRVLVSRPIFPMGKDIGYLPGDIEQKLNPWMQPIFDNVEFLLGSDAKAMGRAQEMINQGMLSIEPLTYIRGRSIPHQYMIVDECLPGDEEVVTDRGKKSIGSLCRAHSKGAELPKALSFNMETESFEWKQIKNGFSKGIREVCTVVAGLKKTRCTPDHPFLTTDGWRHAKDLQSGDYIVMHSESKGNIIHDYEGNNGGGTLFSKRSNAFSVCQVSEIIYDGTKTEVFDIEVEDNHNFVVHNGMVVHNCQNLTAHEVKTIITRAGIGTKIILTGDTHQIDNPYLDASNSGLTYVLERFKGQSKAAHITLTQGERSELAELASNIL